MALLEMMGENPMRRSARFGDILSRCLLCGACAEVCANSVHTTDRIQAGRELMFKARTGGWLGGPLARTIMEGERSGRIVSKGGALFQALFCKKIPENSGLYLRFPLSFFVQRSTIPAISWTPFVKAFRSHVSPNVKGARVGFFVGCGANYIFLDAAWALVRILKKMGVDVVVPEDQVCCGLPAFVSGDTKNARALAEKNIEVFGSLKLDAVLTVCASCGSHLGNLGALFDDDPARQTAAGALAAKHRDATHFLVDNLGLDSYLKKPSTPRVSREGASLRAAYHDPCHLRIGQRITDPPRKILEALQGVDLVDTPHRGRCCGHGGDFNLSHFDLSMKILDRRIEDFQKEAVGAIVSGCTGCLIQFIEGVSRHGLSGSVEVCHPLVLVDRMLP